MRSVPRLQCRQEMNNYKYGALVERYLTGNTDKTRPSATLLIANITAQYTVNQPVLTQL